MTCRKWTCVCSLIEYSPRAPCNFSFQLFLERLIMLLFFNILYWTVLGTRNFIILKQALKKIICVKYKIILTLNFSKENKTFTIFLCEIHVCYQIYFILKKKFVVQNIHLINKMAFWGPQWHCERLTGNKLNLPLTLNCTQYFPSRPQKACSPYTLGLHGYL